MLIAPVTGAQQVDATEHQLAPQLPLGEYYQGVRLLGALHLRKMHFAGEELAEFSGLGWSEDEQLLYALSDRGKLIQLRPNFSAGQLRDIQLLEVISLRGSGGVLLQDHQLDSEGLQVLKGEDGIPDNTLFLLSFERQPRICLHDTRGWQLECHLLPAILSDIASYQGANRALEAVAFHPRWGILTAPERPLPASARSGHYLYALNGRSWRLPMQWEHGRLVGLEVQPDGSVLALEQIQTFLQTGIAVHRLRLEQETPPDSHRPLLKMNDKRLFPGSFRLANFEGIATQGADRFFLISDNNSPLPGKTLLLYFQIISQEANN